MSLKPFGYVTAPEYSRARLIHSSEKLMLSWLKQRHSKRPLRIKTALASLTSSMIQNFESASAQGEVSPRASCIGDAFGTVRRVNW